MTTAKRTPSIPPTHPHARPTCATTLTMRHARLHSLGTWPVDTILSHVMAMFPDYSCDDRSQHLQHSAGVLPILVSLLEIPGQ